MYGLDQHILSNPDRHKINTELEYFYQNNLIDISDLAKHQLDNIKVKIETHLYEVIRLGNTKEIEDGY